MASKQELKNESVELTEQLVLFRTRAQNLDSIKKLNCWGSSIGDVKIVRCMPNLEVCSLSVNKLTTLRDFAHCRNLKELYVRTNNIQCLGDIHYLKNLTKLRSLWLSENPCAEADNYRMTVLKFLPNLQKLDNIVVTNDELSRAAIEGSDLSIPEDFSFSAVFTESTTSSSTEEEVKSSTDSSEKWALPRRKRHQKKRDDLIKERMSYEDGCLTSTDSQRNCLSVKSEETSPRTDDSCADEDNKDTEKSAEVKSDVETNVFNLMSPDNLMAEGLDINLNCNNCGISESDNLQTSNANSEITTESCNTISSPIGSTDFEQLITSTKSEIFIIANSCVQLKKSLEGESYASASQVKSVDITADYASSITEPLTANGISTFLDGTINVGEVASDLKVSRQCSLLDRCRLDDSLNMSEDHQLDSHVTSTQSAIDSKKQVKLSVNNSTQATSTTYFGKESKEPVNWDEYNRLRKEIGVKPMEPTFLAAKVATNDIVKTRNSNILLAVLSLVKELDKDSLDIVLTSIKTRLDSLQ